MWVTLGRKQILWVIMRFTLTDFNNILRTQLYSDGGDKKKHVVQDWDITGQNNNTIKSAINHSAFSK